MATTHIEDYENCAYCAGREHFYNCPPIVPEPQDGTVEAYRAMLDWNESLQTLAEKYQVLRWDITLGWVEQHLMLD